MKKLLKTTIFLIITLIAIKSVVKAVEVTNWNELKTALEGENEEVKLLNDITGETETIDIQGEKILDLNGKILTLNRAGGRLILNHGNLTITGNGTIQNVNGAYGMIDNYGTLSILNGTFIDKGGADGSSFKNRGGTINIKNGEFFVEEHPTGNAVVYSDGVLNITGGKYDSKSGGPTSGAYPIVINTGSGSISNVEVSGSKGGIGVNSGNVVIESGTFTGGAYYGIWITNNGGITNVKINGGTFKGEKYGLYASVDDSNQDTSDAAIEINNGTFIGTKNDAAAVNTARSNQTWSILIKGGTYSSDVKKYVEEGYTQYVADDKYKVTKVTLNNDTIYTKAGGEPVSLGLNFEDESAKNYFEIEGNDIAKINKENLTVEGLKAGKTVITGRLGEDIKNITIISYEVKANDNSVETATVTTIVEDLVKNIIENKNNVDLTETQINAIRSAVDAGKTIISEISTKTVDEKNIEEDAIKVKNVIEENEKIAGYYDINIILKDADTNEEITRLNNVSNNIKIIVTIPKGLPDVQDGYKRTFTVVRVHDGLAEKIDSNTNNDGTISFESSKFSTYAILYSDIATGNKTEEVEGNNLKENKTTKKENTTTNPFTGDNILRLVIILIISSVGALVIMVMKLKNKK